MYCVCINVTLCSQQMYNKSFSAPAYQSLLSKMLSLLLFPLDEARSSKSGILVHCHGGVSRSVTVTVAYLMQKQGLSLNDAYDFVKQRKANIAPNVNFLDQLQDFETELASSPCRSGRCSCSSVQGKKCMSPDPSFLSSSASSSERTTPLSTNTSVSSAESKREFDFL